MLGIAVLFFLGLWLYITKWATRKGWRLGKKYSEHGWPKWLGALLGFFVTLGWYIAFETYQYVRQQIWVSKFCAENPRLVVYITPEELSNIIKIGDYTSYQKNQPKFRDINGNIEVSGEIFYLRPSDKDNAVKSYYISEWIGSSTSYIKEYVIYDPLKLMLYFKSKADSAPRDSLRIKEWYNLIDDCELNSGEFSTLIRLDDSFHSISGDNQ